MITSQYFNITSNASVFASNRHIANKQHCSVWVKSLSNVWTQIPYNDYDLVNNSIILDTALLSTIYSQVELRVADSQEELGTPVTDISTTASIRDEVVIVADNISDITTVSNNIVDLNSIADNIVKAGAVADNMNSVIMVADDLTNINIVASNKTNIDIAASNITEIQNASTNANTATIKASEASTSATSAYNSSVSASNSSTNASNSEIKANKWADNNYNVEVETGKYSAKHWAIVSQNSIGVKVVENISSLKTFNINEANQIEVLGYYTKGDGGGGLFYWDNTSIETDNGGTIIQATGITTGRWKRVYSGTINIKWFGAKGDGVTDDTVAFNDTILFAAINNIGKVEVPTDYYKLLGTIVCPGNLIIDFMNSTLCGNGIGAANDLFQSGYYENGAIHTTIGLPNDSSLCTKLILTNATIINTGKALNLHNCNWQCEFSNLQFFNCTYAIYAASCYYGRFVNLISRGTANNATNAAFYFTRAVNVEQMESIFVTDRILGIEITGGSNGLGLYNCSAESNSTGVLISSETGPITFNSCYFELNTVCGVDINTNYNKFGIAFLGCFFNANINDTHTCIALKLNQTGIIGQSNVLVDMSNRFYDNDIDIDDSNNSAFSTSKIDYHTTPIGDNTLPSINSKVKLGKFTNSNIIQNYVTYLGDRKSYVTGNTIIPFNYCGTAGENTYDMHAFITKTLSGSGTSVIATFDTELICSGSGIFVYHITGYDAQDGYRFYGLVYGTSSTAAILHPLYTSSGKTITLNVVNNRLQFVLGNFNSTFIDQTTIRHM